MACTISSFVNVRLVTAPRCTKKPSGSISGPHWTISGLRGIMAWDERTWDKQERTRSAPAKKDRRRWCKGKIGVEHKLEVMLRKPMQIGDRIEDITCRYPSWGTRSWCPWMCFHKRECVTCGKILEHGLGIECPLWTSPQEKNHV